MGENANSHLYIKYLHKIHFLAKFGHSSSVTKFIYIIPSYNVCVSVVKSSIYTRKCLGKGLHFKMFASIEHQKSLIQSTKWFLHTNYQHFHCTFSMANGCSIANHFVNCWCKMASAWTQFSKRFYWAIFLTIVALVASARTPTTFTMLTMIMWMVCLSGCVQFEFIKSPHYWITTQFVNRFIN